MTEEFEEREPLPAQPELFGLNIDDASPDDLRIMVREHVAVNSTSPKAVAKAADIGESTLSAWMAGTYSGVNANVEKKIRIWLASQRSFATAKVSVPNDTRFIHTRSGKKFLSALEYAQAMPDVVVIVGAAGIGKTSACTHYKETHPNVWHLTAEPSISSCAHVLKYLREEVGLPELDTYRISRAIQQKVQNTQGLIIVDEAQHLTMQALDQLRSLHDRCKIGLALVGNEQVLKRLDDDGRTPALAQLFSRVGMRVKVMRSSIKDIEALLDAAGIEDERQRNLLKAIAQKPGALRGMMKTLRAARKVAAGAGEALGEQHIAQAWTLNGGDGVTI